MPNTQLRSYSSEEGPGRDFVKKYDAHFSSDKVGIGCICTSLVHLAGLMLHIALLFRTLVIYKYSSLFRKVLHFFTSFLFVLLGFGLVISYSISFNQHYYESPDPTQWLFIFPLIPALVMPVIIAIFMACFLVCWYVKTGDSKGAVYILLTAFAFTLPFTMVLNASLFWTLISVIVYPLELGLSFIVYGLFFSCIPIPYDRLHQHITSLKHELFQVKPRQERSHAEELIKARYKFVAGVMFLTGLVIFMTAALFMYYYLFVQNRLINNQNPLQTFLSATLPAAVITVITLRVRKMQNAENEAGGNDVASCSQPFRNEQVLDGYDAIDHSQQSEGVFSNS